MRNFSPAQASNQISKTLLRHGLSVEQSPSSLSSSRYLYVSKPDIDDVFTVKVRISTHDAKPTYERLSGVADFELGNHDMAMTAHAPTLAAAVLRHFGVEPDRHVKLAINRLDDARQIAQQQKTEAEARWANVQEQRNKLKEGFLAWAGDRYEKAQSSGNASARKKKVQRLKRQYEQAVGLELGTMSGV